MTEYFVKGTEPTEYCNVHQKVTFCKDTGKIASDGCENTITKIMIYKDLSDVDLENFEIEDAEYAITAEDISKYCSKHIGKLISPVKYSDKPMEDISNSEKETE